LPATELTFFGESEVGGRRQEIRNEALKMRNEKGKAGECRILNIEYSMSNVEVNTEVKSRKCQPFPISRLPFADSRLPIVDSRLQVPHF
jgi:hypothetical protein